MYRPGSIGSAIEQPDGKILISGQFSRVAGTAASLLSRLSPVGVVDAAFQQNVGTTASIYSLELASNGKIMVNSGGNIAVTAGGLTRTGLLRLNPNGSGDATFNPGTGPTGATVYLDRILTLPNDQTIVVGSFTSFNGVPANNIVRLTSTGAVDATFNMGTGFESTSFAEVNSIVLLPSGKFLVAGSFDSYNGSACNGLARLNADGSFDPSFSSSLGPDSYIVNIMVQPDGKILATGSAYVGAATTGLGLIRVTANGALDTSFNPPAFSDFDSYTWYGNSVQLQPDGKILVFNRSGVTSAGIGRLARLNTDGSPDTSYQVGAGPSIMPNAITLLSSGKLLVAGNFTNFSGILDRPLVLLNSNGTLDQTFQPTVQYPGFITALARQTDGKVVVGGSISEINGQQVHRLVRFNSNGTLDATFATNQTLETTVSDIIIQTNGSILAGGVSSLKRYLPTGALDNSFSTAFNSGSLQLLLQPDGRIVVGSISLSTSVTGIMRLMADGTRDNTFAPNTGTGRLAGVTALALQPNGKILVAGRSFSSTIPYPIVLTRLESTGAVDGSFTNVDFRGGSPNVYTLALQPDGKVMAGGTFTSTSNVTRSNIARINADGTIDAGFVPPLLSGVAYKILLQPNNRVLVGGSFSNTTLPNYLGRLLANGSADTSFGTTAAPNGIVYNMVVQPDGALIIGGAFTTIGGQPYMGLARIIASNVLAVSAPAAVVAGTQAWPVPAHGQLNVQTDARSHAQTLDLLDMLGRVVQHVELRAGTTAASLSCAELPVGTYLLRVNYTEGLVTRRVQVQ